MHIVKKDDVATFLDVPLDVLRGDLSKIETYMIKLDKSVSHLRSTIKELRALHQEQIDDLISDVDTAGDILRSQKKEADFLRSVIKFRTSVIT